MLFIDKYFPKKASDAYFHKDKLKQLERMSRDNSIPHIIFSGPPGCGKKTIISLLLQMIYDETVHDCQDVIYTVVGSGNSSHQIAIKQSDFHIVINPNNNNFDRYLIQDVVKKYAQRAPLYIFKFKKPFKTVLINNVDNLSYYAQTSLRRTMEKYSRNCRFIMWCRSPCGVIEPLRSRCLCFQLAGPTKNELTEFIDYVSSEEDINITKKEKQEIIDKSEGNIKKILWMLQLKAFGLDTNTSYDDIIADIVKYILKCKLKDVVFIRGKLYSIMITNITGSVIIKDILKCLLKSDQISWLCKMNIIEIAAKYEHRLIEGRRDITHLEGFIVGSIYQIHKMQKMQNDQKNVKQ